MNIKTFSNILMTVLWVATAIVGLAWAFFREKLTFDPEPITFILGLVSGAVSTMVHQYGELLEKEEYSTSYALAYGYVNNFLLPTLDKIKDSGEPLIYIYMPEALDELKSYQVKDTMRRVRKMGFRERVINLNFDEGRARDIIVISRNARKIYFDFPKTLLTLESYIDYKSSSSRNSFDDETKLQLGKKYIELFKKHMIELLKDQRQFIRCVNKTLDFDGPDLCAPDNKSSGGPRFLPQFLRKLLDRS